ncbi:hypothetical protein [uncultured Brevundimonas sp.]|uniref:hypothetical protein n=1 Tax=uncultured Brevundimonas sp. TaxID=213418 RepID=UPI002614B5F4|nr:hypothetical protein [uncultured Brevundimonas sp.]
MDEQVDEAVPQRSRWKLRKRWPWLVTLLVPVLIYNLTVWVPVATKLGEDDRNSAASVHVYRSWLVHPNDITIDLMAVNDAATVDLSRALFQAAEALKGREFGRVTLARQGKAVFVMQGTDFAELGEAFSAGENPVYLLRTLPEKLYLPNGEPAFGTWSGGWLGVLTKQMEDLNTFGPSWAAGEMQPAPAS